MATKYPLVWPNYVPPNPPAPAEDPHKIVDGVTPGFFEAFGGWTSYAARQFTDNACAGGFAAVDFNVCFDGHGTPVWSSRNLRDRPRPGASAVRHLTLCPADQPYSFVASMSVTPGSSAPARTRWSTR